MAKTKEQKQQEALARNRAMYPDKLRDYLESQQGGVNYERILRDYGPGAASLNSRETKRVFKEWCEQNKIDMHGNILEPATA